MCSEIVKAFALLLHLQIDLRPADRGLNLGPGADDAGVQHEALDVLFIETGHLGRIEPGKRLAKGLALAQHRDPGQAGLKSFQHQHLPQHARIMLWHTPLGVVVSLHEGVALGPTASYGGVIFFHGLAPGFCWIGSP
jgi:hypothetical protein